MSMLVANWGMSPEGSVDVDIDISSLTDMLFDYIIFCEIHEQSV